MTRPHIFNSVVLCFKLLCRSQSSQTLTAFFVWNKKKKLKTPNFCELSLRRFISSLIVFSAVFLLRYIPFVAKKRKSSIVGKIITLQEGITNLRDYLIANDFAFPQRFLFLAMLGFWKKKMLYISVLDWNCCGLGLGLKILEHFVSWNNFFFRIQTLVRARQWWQNGPNAWLTGSEQGLSSTRSSSSTCMMRKGLASTGVSCLAHQGYNIISLRTFYSLMMLQLPLRTTVLRQSYSLVTYSKKYLV